MNTNNVQTQIFGRIRILFGPKFLDEYEYKYYSGFNLWPNTNTNICYSNNIQIIFEYRIIRSPLILGIFWAYLGHILGISWAYIKHIFGLSWAYLEYPLAHLVCPLLAFFYKFYIMYHISWYSSKYVHEPDEVYICWILPETSVPQTGKKFPERKNYVTQFEDRKVTMSKLFRRWLKNLI